MSAEREEYLRKYEELAQQEHSYKARERILRELEETVERLKRDVDKYQADLEDTERRYRAQIEDLRSESNKLNEINKELREELATQKNDDPTKRNGYQSTVEHTRESLRRRSDVS